MQSSPFPDDLKSARLQVQVGSPLAEVFLIDHEFALVERSIGDLDARVEPGVYKVKARLGDATTEQLIVLNGDQEVDLRDELSIASPAPIEGTSLAHESAVRVAVEESARVGRRTGSGAEVFLLTRRWVGESPDDVPDRSSLTELSLHSSDGKVLEDLAHVGSSAAGRTVEVDPGTYFLRWYDSSGIAAEQTLEAIDGWQTQVFMLDEAHAPDDPGRHHVSVLMSQHGFEPDDSMLQRVEEARAALADERRVASEFISKSLFAKADNPILGLFGAHLMLLAKEAVEQAEDDESLWTADTERVLAPVVFNQSVFDTAVGNLCRLLGAGHPDVVALSTKASEPDPLPPVTAPPMLWRSWLLLIDASNESPDLLPVAVWRRALRLLPVRPFLVWSPADADAKAAEEWERDMESALQGSAAEASGAPDEETRRRLTQQLLVPRAAIDEAVGDRAS